MGNEMHQKYQLVSIQLVCVPSTFSTNTLGGPSELGGVGSAPTAGCGSVLT